MTKARVCGLASIFTAYAGFLTLLAGSVANNPVVMNVGAGVTISAFAIAVATDFYDRFSSKERAL